MTQDKAIKLRFPRKINITGKSISIKFNRKKMSSEFDGGARKINLGVKGLVAEERLDAFLHETIEAIHEIRKTCYERPYIESTPDVSDYLYILTHDELNVFVSDLVPIILRLIEINRN